MDDQPICDGYDITILNMRKKKTFSIYLQIPRGENLVQYIKKELMKSTKRPSKRFLVKSIVQVPTCSGCRDKSTNQLAHIGVGGCECYDFGI